MIQNNDSSVRTWLKTTDDCYVAQYDVEEDPGQYSTFLMALSER